MCTHIYYENWLTCLWRLAGPSPQHGLGAWTQEGWVVRLSPKARQAETQEASGSDEIRRQAAEELFFAQEASLTMCSGCQLNG